MSTPNGTGNPVTVTEARQIVTHRLAAYDQAIAILGESPMGTALRNGRAVWERMAQMLGEAPRVMEACECGSCDTRIVAALQMAAAKVADRTLATKGETADYVALTEIVGMFRTDWSAIRHDLHVEAEQEAGRGDRS